LDVSDKQGSGSSSGWQQQQQQQCNHGSVSSGSRAGAV
jgi:hypothetical protein